VRRRIELEEVGEHRLCRFCHRWVTRKKAKPHQRRCQRKHRGRTFYGRLMRRGIAKGVA